MCVCVCVCVCTHVHAIRCAQARRVPSPSSGVISRLGFSCSLLHPLRCPQNMFFQNVNFPKHTSLIEDSSVAPIAAGMEPEFLSTAQVPVSFYFNDRHAQGNILADGIRGKVVQASHGTRRTPGL